MKEYNVQIVSIGLLLGMYIGLYSVFYKQTPELEANRIIRSITAVLEGHMTELKADVKFENPYDLFTHIYPSLRDMKNEHIDELIDLIDTYNTHWIQE